MRTLLRYKGLYPEIEDGTLEYLYFKYQKTAGSQISKERKLEELLDRIREAKKNPSVEKIGNVDFVNVIHVEDIKMPIGHRKVLGRRTGVAIYKDIRIGVLSDGNVTGDSVTETDRGKIVTRSFNAIDVDFYFAKIQGTDHTEIGDRIVFREIYWHKAFLNKVKAIIGGLERHEIEILISKSHYEDDDPRMIIKAKWLETLKQKLIAYCYNVDDKKRIRSKMVDERIGDILEKTSNLTLGDSMAMHQRYYNAVRSFNVLSVSIDRFVEWSIFMNTPIEDILDYTVKRLFKEFFVDVTKKANRLRDEILKRYGFRKMHISVRENKLPFEFEEITDAFAGEIVYSDTDSAFCSYDPLSGVGKDCVMWVKRHNSHEVTISERATVHIDGHRICIVPVKDDTHLPPGDRIVQRVFAVGTELRNEIYTLNRYREILEDMFAGYLECPACGEHKYERKVSIYYCNACRFSYPTEDTAKALLEIEKEGGEQLEEGKGKSSH